MILLATAVALTDASSVLLRNDVVARCRYIAGYPAATGARTYMLAAVARGSVIDFEFR
jgi:hypothetical protein